MTRSYASYNVNVFERSSAGIPSHSRRQTRPSRPARRLYTAFPQHPKDPNALNWLFGVEQQLPGQFVTVINYSANRVNHQQAGVNFAAINENPAESVSRIFRTCLASGSCG